MRVRVPASIANLGPGFDVLAMAVDLWLEVEAQPSTAPDWTFEGELAPGLGGGADPISALAMRGRVRSQIPVGVGLGSSAAARLAAAALSGAPDPFREAWAREGHADNVAAAAFGGVRLVARDRVEELPAPELEVALVVALEPLSTQAARSRLPEAVPRPDAVFNLASLALLLEALHGRRWELLAEGMRDRLHEPFRRPLYPWVGDALEAALGAGAHGAAVAGAGPSAFALCAPGRGQEVARAMANASGGKGRPLVTRVTREGMRVER
ncbi:MAG: homoserine kinase [Candidatus Dormibacterales bacterium]